MAASITHLVSVEVIEGLLSTLRMWTSVAVMWIETVINVSVEIVSAVEPRAGSDEHPSIEPLGPIVSVWSTGVRGEVVVAIRAPRLGSDIDRDLGADRARCAQHGGNHGRKSKKFPIAHGFVLTAKKSNPGAKVINH
jgi:hypothetical protein